MDHIDLALLESLHPEDFAQQQPIPYEEFVPGFPFVMPNDLPAELHPDELAQHAWAATTLDPDELFHPGVILFEPERRVLDEHLWSRRAVAHNGLWTPHTESPSVIGEDLAENELGLFLERQAIIADIERQHRLESDSFFVEDVLVSAEANERRKPKRQFYSENSEGVWELVEDEDYLEIDERHRRMMDQNKRECELADTASLEPFGAQFWKTGAHNEAWPEPPMEPFTHASFNPSEPGLGRKRKTEARADFRTNKRWKTYDEMDDAEPAFNTGPAFFTGHPWPGSESQYSGWATATQNLAFTNCIDSLINQDTCHTPNPVNEYGHFPTSVGWSW